MKQFAEEPESEIAASDLYTKDKTSTLSFSSIIQTASDSTLLLKRETCHPEAKQTSSKENTNFKKVEYAILPLKSDPEGFSHYDIPKKLRLSNMYVNTTSQSITGQRPACTPYAHFTCDFTSVKCSQIKTHFKSGILEATFFPPHQLEINRETPLHFACHPIIHSTNNQSISASNISSIFNYLFGQNLPNQTHLSPQKKSVPQAIAQIKAEESEITNTSNNKTDHESLKYLGKQICLLRFDRSVSKFTLYKQFIDEPFLQLIESSQEQWIDQLFHTDDFIQLENELSFYFENLLSSFSTTSSPETIRNPQSQEINSYQIIELNKSKNIRIGANLFFQQGIYSATSIDRTKMKEERILPDFFMVEQMYFSQIQQNNTFYNRSRSNALSSTNQTMIKKLIQKDISITYSTKYQKLSQSFLLKYYPKQQKWQRRGKNQKSKELSSSTSLSDQNIQIIIE